MWRHFRSPVRIISLVANALFVVIGPSRAVAEPSSNSASREIYGGVDAADDQWLAYTGMTFAPFSRDLYSDGWRLRFGGGYGQYSYRAARTAPGCGTAWEGEICDTHTERFRVAHSYVEALVGYSFQFGQLTTKAFVGAAMSSEHHLTGQDAKNDFDGTEFGAKGALEFWLNINETVWTSLDISYATARNETASRWRAGWRLTPQISIGPELRYDRNIETGDGAWNGRGGAFARYEWTGGELSLATGGAWWIDGWDMKNPSPYATLNVLFQY
jgi:hypothetical protein